MTDYFVDLSDGDDSLAGTAEGTAWKYPPSHPDATGTSASTTPTGGDIVYIKAGSTSRITTFWNYADSGSAGNPVIYDVYGTGEKPIFDSRVQLSGWTLYSGNIWQKGSLTSQINRVFFENIATGPAEDKDAVNSTNGFYYDAAADILYIYSNTNPDSEYETVDVLDASISFPIRVRADNYVTFKNIEFRGGNTSCFLIQNAAQGITLEDCNFRYFESKGIFVQGEVATTIKDITIKNNLIDKKWHTSENDPSASPGGDGVSVQESAESVLIKGNIIRDVGHSGVNITSINGSLGGVHNVIIENNEMSGPNSNYMRGFDVAAGSGMTSGNILRGNKIYNTTTRNQIGGDGTIVHSNTIDTVTGTETQAGDAGEGIGLQTFLSGGTNTIVDSCKIYNNVIVNCKNIGIRLWTSNSIAMGSNEIVNNTVVNCDTANGVQFSISADSGAIATQTVDNNQFYHSTVSDVVHSRGTNYTVAEANDETDFTDNLQSDPQLMTNFTIPSTSPCVGAGKYVGMYRDYNGKEPKNPPDIGAFNYIATYLSDITRLTDTTRAVDTSRAASNRRGVAA